MIVVDIASVSEMTTTGIIQEGTVSSNVSRSHSTTTGIIPQTATMPDGETVGCSVGAIIGKYNK